MQLEWSVTISLAGIKDRIHHLFLAKQPTFTSTSTQIKYEYKYKYKYKVNKYRNTEIPEIQVIKDTCKETILLAQGVQGLHSIKRSSKEVEDLEGRV